MTEVDMLKASAANVVPVGIGGDLLAKLQSGIANSRAQTVVTGGKPFLRMLRDGVWVYGQKDEEVQEGSSWAINPLSLGHGWCCWPKNDGGGPNKMLGEHMVPMFEPRPPKPEPIEGFPFTQQFSCEMRCLDGEDQGTEVLYKVNSVGGTNAIQKLLEVIQRQLADNPAFPCPVVDLLTDHYQHPQYGKIYVPVFDVTGFCDMNGRMQGDTQVLPAAEVQKEPEPEPDVFSEPVMVAQPTKPAKAATRAKEPLKAANVKPPLKAANVKPPLKSPKQPPAPEAPAPTARRRPVRR